jgi:ribosomal protein S18 acetylase RimI-like enzyme
VFVSSLRDLFLVLRTDPALKRWAKLFGRFAALDSVGLSSVAPTGLQGWLVRGSFSLARAQAGAPAPHTPHTHTQLMHPLDNVIWRALTTRDAQFAESFEEARRFVREVGPLGAFREHGAQGFASLAGLVGSGGTVGLFLDDPYESRDGWDFVAGAPLLQMVADNGIGSPAPANPGAELIELGPQDSLEMIELTALTKPGPFGSRTHELGTYLGIRTQGKLVAMAGERLKVPGHTEVSAVCTLPEHTGKGYAGILMAEVMRRIRERGETPFLHVRADNGRAIDIYKRLGFRERKLGHFAVLRKA